MSKYIDADKLKELLKERQEEKDYREVIWLIDSLQQEQPVEGLEEAAFTYENDLWESGFKDCGYSPQEVNDAFKAGAEWQKEQDQPITGNSLEQEWLRYVDKKKKECRGELPSLGEYGWLQIARHFAEWMKSKMLEDAVEGTYGATTVGHSAFFPDKPIKDLCFGDKVRVIIIKEDEK